MNSWNKNIRNWNIRKIFDIKFYKLIWMELRKIRYITDNGIKISIKEKDIFHLYENIGTEKDIREIYLWSIPDAFLHY